MRFARIFGYSNTRTKNGRSTGKLANLIVNWEIARAEAIRKGWMCYELPGIVRFNTRSVCKIDMNAEVEVIK